MLTFYYHPLSPISRRVWIALLEKEIPFEPVLVDLSRKEQFKADFLAISPFHHVPVVAHEDVCLFESLAILDYLEHRFPTVSLSPATPAEIARMRMVQLTATNELMPKLVAVANQEQVVMPTEKVQHLETCFRFFEKQLGDRAYFGGDRLNLADVVAGTAVPLFAQLGIDLQPYPRLCNWQARLLKRPAWSLTSPDDDALHRWKRWIQLQVKRYQRQRLRDERQN